jgi:hypothetical protein
MSEFRTTVRLTPSIHQIGLKNKVLTIGSCFADAIGERLNKFKFQSLVNPFGVIYNPVSIHKVLEYALRNRLPEADTYLQHQEISANYDFHSTLSAINNTALAESIQNRINTTHQFLTQVEFIFVTYGTAWIYRRKDNGQIVANCHKMPAQNFEKSLLSVDDVVDSFVALHRDLKSLNARARIILTLSPVRHIKDTIELNSVSKSILRIACHQIAEKFPDVEYFPAYEMMIDDLRDYRFYKSDMLHPSEDAEEYIWKKFTDKYFSEDTISFLKQWSNLLAAMAHKPFHPQSSTHQKFLKDTIEKLQQLKREVNVDSELAQMQAQLRAASNQQ